MHAAFSKRLTGFHPEVVISCLLTALGLMVMSGWLLRVPAMVVIRTGLLPMVFNTGLCFLLTGIALPLMQRDDSASRFLRRAIGIALLLLCSATLVEMLRDRSLGIDLPSLQTWYHYGNTRPGRMAPNTALGFILIAAAILLAERVVSKRQALGVIVLTFGVLAIGLTGLVGYSLAPELLFGWARSARMAVHTATGMILASAALWLTWSKSDWYLSRLYFREDEKIRLLGAVILVVVTVTVGLLGFVQLQAGLKETLESDLDVIVQSRGAWFKTTVDQTTRRAIRGASLSGLEEASRAMLASFSPSFDGKPVLTAGNRLIAEGFRGIAIRDANGRLPRFFGRINLQPEVAARLNEDATSELLWDGEIVLRTHLGLFSKGRRTGEILLDEAVPALEKNLFDGSPLGKTGEIGACVVHGDVILCFPGNRHSAPYTVAQRSKQGIPLPVEFAIAGKSGIIHTLDYRGINVVAAYRPLAPGLGFVVKQDATEVYAPVRGALATGTPIILIVALLGAALLYSQLKPLATGMWASELAALEKELEMRAIMDAAGDGILMGDEHGVIHSANAVLCRTFGYEPGELIGMNVITLIPVESRAAQLQDLEDLAAGRILGEIGKPNVEVAGLRKDGTEFPLELTVTSVPIANKRLFVGIMRDITARKEMEHKLSSMAQYDFLTGLPNRSLFMDRLSMAFLRANRSTAAMALMFLDLDGFKQVNDMLGHQAGDELLIEFSRRLSSMVRKSDTVARLAGDEFTVVLETLTNPQVDARAIAQKILDSMQHPFSICGREVMVTASIGMVIHEARNEDMTVADLLQRADKEMYSAKRSGKNAVSIADRVLEKKVS